MRAGQHKGISKWSSHSSPTSDSSVASAQYRDGESVGEGRYITSGSGDGITVSGDLPHNVHYHVSIHSIVHSDGTGKGRGCARSQGSGCGQ